MPTVGNSPKIRETYALGVYRKTCSTKRCLARNLHPRSRKSNNDYRSVLALAVEICCGFVTGWVGLRCRRHSYEMLRVDVRRVMTPPQRLEQGIMHTTKAQCHNGGSGNSHGGLEARHLKPSRAWRTSYSSLYDSCIICVHERHTRACGG